MKSCFRLAAAVSLAAIAVSPGCEGGPRTARPAPNAPATAKNFEATVNSKGLREDREINYAKPKGRLRIVCVGGSLAFGDGVAHDATFGTWIQKNMRGRAYDVEVLNAGKPGRGLAESATLLENEYLKYEPDLVIVSVQKDEGTPTAEVLQRIETLLKSRRIVYVLLAVPDYVTAPGYTPSPPAVYVVPSKAALDVFAGDAALVDAKGRWTEFAHNRMGNALAELIVGAPLICCAKGPVPERP